MVTILNSSVLTEFGTYTYTHISLEKAKEMLLKEGYHSAIGHEGNAILLSKLTDLNIPFNRIEYRQNKNETALVFKIKKRLNQVQTVGADELSITEYEFGLLKRID